MRMLLILAIAAPYWHAGRYVQSCGSRRLCSRSPWRWLRRTARGGRLSSLGEWLAAYAAACAVLNATLRYGFIVVRL